MSDHIEIKADLSIGETGAISGLAWPFDRPDSVGDIIEKGAFDMPSAVPMLLEHSNSGAVGIWNSLTQTDTGLEVKGQLFVEAVEPAKEVRQLFRKGKVTGLSIGFRADAFDCLPNGGRKFSAVSLTEISLCRRPVHPGARITSVKSQQENTHMENENTAEAQIEQKAANDNMAALTARLDKLEAKSNRPVAANDNDAGSADAEFKAFAEFIRTGDRTEVKALGYGAPSTGGVLAPDQVSASILEKITESSPIRSLTAPINLGGPLLQLPRLVDEVAPAPRAELGTAVESEPSFELIDIKPFEMAVTVPVTRVMLQDAQIDLGAYLRNHIARKMGEKEARWFVTGNGTTQAEGVLTSDEVGEFEVEAIDADGLIDLFYSLKTAYSNNGVWLMNRKTIAAIRKLKDTDGSYLWERSIAAGQPGTLLNRPVYASEDMPNIGEGTTPIIFGDFGTGYTIADHIGFETVDDRITEYGKGIVKIHASRRVGGKVVMGEALTKLKIAA